MTYGAERRTEPRKLPKRLVLFAATLGILAGCEEGPKLGFLQPKDKETTTEASGQSTQLIERDVEAPEVFEVTEAGLWDGRPSLGGVWVAHADVTEPERVIIRNSSNGKFVIGALFRREREIPGPRIQASSDAAAALGMLAGAPVELHVTALRRETVGGGDQRRVCRAVLRDPRFRLLSLLHRRTALCQGQDDPGRADRG